VAIELTAEDKLAARRLNGLLDYVEALIKLDERPATQLAQHKLADGSQFILHQHELAGLPGLTFDISDPDSPIWLRMERLQRTTPPQVNEACRAWVDVPNDPIKPPVIREAQHLRVLEAEKDRMIKAGEARPEDCVPSIKTAKKDDTPGVFFDVMLRLEDRPSIRETLEAYCVVHWAEWAEREKPVAVPSRSISDYSKLRNVFCNPGASNPLN
jgi:hypothetical protein